MGAKYMTEIPREYEVEFLGTDRPSQAVRAMIDGLLAADRREGFKVDMNTFERYFEGICYGCAATCALQQMGGYPLIFDTSGVHRHVWATRREMMEQFVLMESAIDFFRLGVIKNLLKFYGYNYLGWLKACADDAPEKLYMTNGTWRDQIPVAEQWVEFLESKGL